MLNKVMFDRLSEFKNFGKSLYTSHTATSSILYDKGSYSAIDILQEKKSKTNKVKLAITTRNSM